LKQPFKINIEQTILDDLKERISNTRWADTSDDDTWQYGISLSYMKSLAHYWAHDFDWRKTEDSINIYSNFITEIDGYKIHFLHIKSKWKNAIPLIISHGWPGSFLEMLKVIPLLIDHEDLSFDLVIPSLLGFGFSDKSGKDGINSTVMARLWVKLMNSLGYGKFIAQGGDLGAIISTRIAMKYPDSLLGLHLNYIPFNYKPYMPVDEKLTREETDAQQKTYKFFMAEGAYSQIQGTKPITLCYELNDSPVGLCAWILQIFKSFSNPKKDPDNLFNRDELLAHVTLYWVTQTIHTSMSFYSDSKEKSLSFGKDDFIKVPVGIAHYPYPDSFPARKYVERGYNVQYWNDLSKGGHFAAMEQPELFADDLRKFATKLNSIKE
jgi:pimeloyl-ACP methyl ester carboxylesterase